MAKDATKIFGGPAKTIEIDDASNFGSSNVLGYASAEVSITFEPAPVETLSGQMFQPKGLLKFSMRLQQTDDTTIGYLKTARTTEHYIRITDYNDNAYPSLVPMLLSYQMELPFNSSDVHTILVTGQIAVEEPDDGINFQS